MPQRLALLLFLAGCGSSYATKKDSSPADQDGDGYSVLVDCDDTSSAINPGATEVCNGLDDNCDGQIDNGGETARYEDADRDGYGDPNNALAACDPAGVADSTDCDDADASISPAGSEGMIADGVDNDCNGSIDDGITTVDTGDGGTDSGSHTGESGGHTGHTGHDTRGDDTVTVPPETGIIWDTGRDTDHDTGGSSTGGSPAFDAAWSGDKLVITISGGHGSYFLGIADTDPTATDPWTGEDCLDGYISSTGEVYLLCHEIPRSGATLVGGGDPDTLDTDTQTVFTASDMSVMTFAAWSSSTMDCWTWGADTSYYTSAGCMVF